MKQMFATLAVIVSVFIFSSANAVSETAAKKLPAVDTSDMKSLGMLGPSFYWVALEKDNQGDKTEKVYDTNNKVIAKISVKFMRHLKLEGTGLLENGKLLNFAQWHYNDDGTKEVRYRVCGKAAPCGYGYEGRALKAFRSVAVDPTVVPLDSLIFIPQARGAVLPDGTIHDGYFHAVDIGDAIQNKRIDVFTSFGDQSGVFGKVGLIHMKLTEVFVVPALKELN